MAYKIEWDNDGERLYETGVDRGVLYPKSNGTYGNGVAWNGLTNVSSSPSGGEPSPIYADNIKYLNLTSIEELGLTIEAYTYPDEFAECDGSTSFGEGAVSIGQQKRSEFGFCYRTLVGNDEDGNDHGYKIHLVYGCYASPSEKSYATVNDSPEAISFSWEVSTTPVPVTYNGVTYKPTAELVVDSTKCTAANLTALENILYGQGTTEAELPSPVDVIALATTGSR